MADVLFVRPASYEKDYSTGNKASPTANHCSPGAAAGATPSPATRRGTPTRFVRTAQVNAAAAPGATMDWYILFDRGAQAGLYKAETEEAAIERACQLLRAGIIVREVGRFDERRRAMKAAKLVKICAERQRREASEPER
jgi:hypothetical protein